MKKCLVVISVMCLTLLAGCGGTKVLKCSYEKTSLGIKVKQDVEVNFVSDKIETIKQVYKIVLPEKYKSTVNTLVSTYKKQYENLYKGSTVKTEKVSDTEIRIDVDTDYKSMTVSEKKKSGFYGSEKYDVNRKSLESKGYTCE